MPSPFPGMDPFLETNPIFHELHTQMLAAAQAQLQPQLRPKYVARLERHLSEGSVWDFDGAAVSLEGKEPDVTVVARGSRGRATETTVVLTAPTASVLEELDVDELQLRKQRRIVIYVQAKPRLAVASIELLSPSNKLPGSVTQARYMAKRNSALRGGLHWIEIDLLRGGERPAIPVELPRTFDYLAYIAQATATGWNHQAFAWGLRDQLPRLGIPLLGSEQARLDVGACFAQAYTSIAADDEVNYAKSPPPPPLPADERKWMLALLRRKGLRK